ncbi:Alpha/Beta hydrolase protein [Chaetomium sp. MPI-SDFR-AT-0129]|nr:Alpha/Beta hydrolase protein [Chaetomium sp. MPI-SDFR-AT-0129]
MIPSTLLTLFLTTLAAQASCFPDPDPSPPGLIDLGYARHIPTSINTTASGVRVAIYNNIRFAQSPTGDLRFRAPNTDLPHVDGIQDGSTAEDVACISSAPWYVPFPGLNGTTWGQEDCLFLDVYVPEGVQPGDDVPVLHNFHGSAYAFGSKGTFFDPMGLFDAVGKGNGGKFIAVANNYRMGVSGFTWAQGEDLDGNVGLLDCLAAAEWTSKYIHHFGGDPQRITAIGQSAGAGILYYLTVLHDAHGTLDTPLPFQQIFISSPAGPQRRNVTSRQRQLFDLVLDTANTTSLAGLRALSETDFIALNDAMINQMPSEGGGGNLGPILGFGPAPDGTRIPDIPSALIQRGVVNHDLKGLVLGSMASEGQTTSSDEGMPDAFGALARRTLPNASNETVQEVLDLYYTPGLEPQLAWDWTTDVVFACNAFNLARGLPGKARRYIMSTPPATHGQDLMYYFYVDDQLTPVSDPQLVEPFQTKLLAFLHGEDPEWPLYGDDERLFNITDSFEATTLPDSLRARCDLVNKLVFDPVNGA